MIASTCVAVHLLVCVNAGGFHAGENELTSPGAQTSVGGSSGGGAASFFASRAASFPPSFEVCVPSSLIDPASGPPSPSWP